MDGIDKLDHFAAYASMSWGRDGMLRHATGELVTFRTLRRAEKGRHFFGGVVKHFPVFDTYRLARDR